MARLQHSTFGFLTQLNGNDFCTAPGFHHFQELAELRGHVGQNLLLFEQGHDTFTTKPPAGQDIIDKDIFPDLGKNEETQDSPADKKSQQPKERTALQE